MSKEANWKRSGVYLEPDVLNSVAWAKLTLKDRDVFLMFRRKRFRKKKKGRSLRRKEDPYETLNDGKITMTYREAKAAGISSTSFNRALKKLIDVGFIDIVKPGHISQHVEARRPTLFGESERWRKYDTPEFKPSPRKKATVHYGFQGRNAKPR